MYMGAFFVCDTNSSRSCCDVCGVTVESVQKTDFQFEGGFFRLDNGNHNCDNLNLLDPVLVVFNCMSRDR